MQLALHIHEFQPWIENSTDIEKNLHISGLVQFKTMLCKGQLYFAAVWRRLRMEAGRPVWRRCVGEVEVSTRVLAVELASKQIYYIFWR